MTVLRCRHQPAFLGLVFAALYLLASPNFAAAEQGRRLNVYTAEYFSDLNPFRERTYISDWLGQFVASRLFRRACITQDARIKMLPECAADGLAMRRNEVVLKARSDRNGFRCKVPDNTAIPQTYIVESVRSTVALLSRKSMQRNYYHGNKFRVRGSTSRPLLKMSTPSNAGLKGLEFLDFPLVVPGATGVDNPLPPRAAETVNKITFGAWQLDRSTEGRLRVKLRRDPRDYLPASAPFDPVAAVTTMRVINSQAQQFSRNIIRTRLEGEGDGTPRPSVANLGHVFLNVGPAIGQLIDSTRNYAGAFAQNARGPFYASFNFSQRGIKQELFGSKDFRRLVANSLWASPVMQNQFSGLLRRDPKMNGTWNGQALLPLQDGQVPRPSSDSDLEEEIQRFLKQNERKFIAINLNVWITAEGRRMLTRVGISQLERSLNSRWVCDQRCGSHAPGEEVGIFFRFPPLSEQTKPPKNAYDIVIDRMAHGERLIRIADAFSPNDSSNVTYMTDTQLPAHRRKLWRSETSRAKADMTAWLRDTYNVIVLGEFAFRDYYLKPLVETAERELCGRQAAQIIPPMGASYWRLPK